MHKRYGFTIVEILIAIAVIAILAIISAVIYGGVQERAATVSVRATTNRGSDILGLHFIRNKDYPPNFAGTEFIPDQGVATALWTNAPIVRTYSPGFLSPEENTQLFINACNTNVPLVVSGSTYFTSCGFAGNSVNIHIKGQKGSNVLLKGPEIDKSLAESSMTCSVPQCAETAQLIFQQFEDQGGSWPLQSSGVTAPLPEPDVVTATGPATKFCFEVWSEDYPNVASHATPNKTTPQPGRCPEDPELHYP